MSGPYIGSLKTLIFILLSCPIILFFKWGWVVPIACIVPMLTWALYDWNTAHGKIAKGIYYDKSNLIVPKWIFNINTRLIRYCKENQLEYKQRFYRFWIIQNGQEHLMYTFPRFPWTSTVIGFKDETSKKFFIKTITLIFQSKQ